MNHLLHTLESCLQTTAPKRVWLGFSGGLDSTALLHLLSQSAYLKQQSIPLAAIHVHHGLSPQADAWATQCVTVCSSLNIPCHIEYLRQRPEKAESIEAWARHGRRAVFSAYLAAGDVLLTAHHQEDQAETVLLKLLRGAGAKGLAAMAAVSALGQGRLLRPLLHVPYSEIENYVETHHLAFVEDESNAHLRFDRNYLRHTVLPMIEQRWPQYAVLLARAADNCREDAELLGVYTRGLLASLQENIPPDQLNIEALINLSLAQRHSVLREWLYRAGVQSVERQHLIRLEQEVLLAQADKNPQLYLAPITVRRYQKHLYVVPSLETPEPYCITWDGKTALSLPGWSESLTVEGLKSQGLQIEALDWQQVTVRSRHGLKRCRPKGRAHSQTFKKLLQEYQVAPWLRERLPLLYCQDTLVMVIGGWVCE